MKILSGDVNAEFCISKMTTGNENIRENIQGTRDGAVNFATSKHIFEKRTMSHIETFFNALGPLLMERPQSHCSHLDR